MPLPTSPILLARLQQQAAISFLPLEAAISFVLHFLTILLDLIQRDHGLTVNSRLQVYRKLPSEHPPLHQPIDRLCRTFRQRL